jgi:hypothetical protein
VTFTSPASSGVISISNGLTSANRQPVSAVNRHFMSAV